MNIEKRTMNSGSNLISADTPDWTREQCGAFRWNPGAQLLQSIRAYHRMVRRTGPWASLGRRLAVIRHRFWSVVCAADIPVNAKLGGGLLLPHPQGIVIHPDSVVGPNCLLFQGVTLGVGGAKEGAPILGGHVDVGAGAKILGGVRIGDHAVIGANAVVLRDVPSGATAVGIPARIVQKQPASREDGTSLSTTPEQVSE